MTKQNLKKLKKVSDQLLAGVYNPEMLTEAYRILKPNDDLTFVLPRQKKQAVMNFMNYQYNDLIKEENGVEINRTNDNPIDTHIVTEKPEEVKMEKPTTTKKKRVYKKKTNVQSK